MQTIIFSDFHMSPAAENDGVWMRYRNPRFFVDSEYAALVEEILVKLAGQPFEIVFNGDMFELDGADAFVGREGRADRHVGCEAGEAGGLTRILDDHGGFIEATAALLAGCERMVFISGNHDLGLYWPTVQHLLRRRLVDAADKLKDSPSRTSLDGRVRFEQWFYRPSNDLFIEHGQFYDPASLPPDPLVVSRGDGRGMWMTLGSAGFRYIMGGIGTMNPHAHETFILGGRGYLKHWWRYYVRGRRSLIRTWFKGSLGVAKHLFGQSDTAHPDPQQCRDELVAASMRSGLSAEQLQRLRDLHARLAATSRYAVLRELWLDRLLLFLVLAAVTGLSGFLFPWLVTAMVAMASVAAMALYESYAPASDLDGYQKQLPGLIEAVAQTTGARVVVHAHTHQARKNVLPDGTLYLDTGTWSPEFLDPECTVRKNTPHTFAWLHTAHGEPVRADLLTWRGGRICELDPADEVHTVPGHPEAGSLQEVG